MGLCIPGDRGGWQGLANTEYRVWCPQCGSPLAVNIGVSPYHWLDPHTSVNSGPPHPENARKLPEALVPLANGGAVDLAALKTHQGRTAQVRSEFKKLKQQGTVRGLLTEVGLDFQDLGFFEPDGVISITFGGGNDYLASVAKDKLKVLLRSQLSPGITVLLRWWDGETETWQT